MMLDTLSLDYECAIERLCALREVRRLNLDCECEETWQGLNEALDEYFRVNCFNADERALVLANLFCEFGIVYALNFAHTGDCEDEGYFFVEIDY